MFHDQASYAAEYLELKTLSTEELSLIGKVGLNGQVLEENIGDVRSFWTIDADGGVYDWKSLQAVLRNKTGNVYVYVELTEPGGNEVWYDGVNNGYITQADVNQITQVFDQGLTEADIYGRNRAVFGAERPTGVDNDSHVTLLLLDIDGDEGDGYSGGGYTQGYFYLINEYANTTPFCVDCPYSNQRKIIFIDTYPSIDWRTSSTPWTPDRNHADDFYEGVNQSYGVIAHEFQHMIHWFHDADEAVWVDEGAANYAYHVNGFGHPEVHVSAFENSPDTQLTSWAGTMENYGSAYLFMLYLAEQYGGNATITALVNESGNNVTGINNTLSSRGYNTSFNEVFPNWVVANYADDTSFSSGEYGYSAIDTAMNLSASKTSYSSSGTGSVNTHAGDYLLFSNGNQSPLNISFDGQDGREFTALVVEKVSSGVSAVSEISLSPGNSGSGIVYSFGVSGKNATLVIAGGSGGGSYSYGAEYAPDVALPTPSLQVEMSYPNEPLNVSVDGSFNVSASVSCLGATCGNVVVVLDPMEFSHVSATTTVPGTTTLPSTTTVAGDGTTTVLGTTSVPSTTTVAASATTTVSATTTTQLGTTTTSTTSTTSSTTTTVAKSGAVPEDTGSPFYTLDANPLHPANLSCLSAMAVNTSCNMSWRVKVNGSGGPYTFFVSANASEGASANSTAVNITIIPQTPGILSADVVVPNASTEVRKHNSFNFTVQVNCIGGFCGNVTATVNSSSGIIPEDSGSPFYSLDANPRYSSNLSCLRNMTNSSCNVTWRLNATGNSSTTHIFYTIVNNTLIQNQSATVNVTILAAPISTQNYTIDANASQPVQVNATQANTTITLTTSENVSNATLTLEYYEENPESTAFTETTLGRFYKIEGSSELAGNITYALLTLYYMQDWVNQSNLNESTLAIYWLNVTASLWEMLSTNMSWVHATGVNTTGDFVFANLTHFSTYTISGQSLSVTHTRDMYVGWNLISLPVNI